MKSASRCPVARFEDERMKFFVMINMKLSEVRQVETKMSVKPGENIYAPHGATAGRS